MVVQTGDAIMFDINNAQHHSLKSLPRDRFGIVKWNTERALFYRFDHDSDASKPCAFIWPLTPAAGCEPVFLILENISWGALPAVSLGKPTWMIGNPELYKNQKPGPGFLYIEDQSTFIIAETVDYNGRPNDYSCIDLMNSSHVSTRHVEGWYFPTWDIYVEAHGGELELAASCDGAKVQQRIFI